MRVRSDDPGVRGLSLDRVDLANDVERILRLGMFALLENLSSRVRDASGTHAFARLRDGVVAGVLIDNESSGGIAEDSLRRIAASIGRVDEDHEILRDEVPKVCAMIKA